MMVDSNGTLFPSGARRDDNDTKGRCDLMPLDIVGEAFSLNENMSKMFMLFEKLKNEHDYKNKYKQALEILTEFFWHNTKRSKKSLILDLSVLYKIGASHYGEDNWKKGIPDWSCLSSALRHYIKYSMMIPNEEPVDDERHDIAFIWNMITFMYNMKMKIKEEEEKNGICK